MGGANCGAASDHPRLFQRIGPGQKTAPPDVVVEPPLWRGCAAVEGSDGSASSPRSDRRCMRNLDVDPSHLGLRMPRKTDRLTQNTRSLKTDPRLPAQVRRPLAMKRRHTFQGARSPCHRHGGHQRHRSGAGSERNDPPFAREPVPYPKAPARLHPLEVTAQEPTGTTMSSAT
jgi:hypothetical protein